MKIRRGDTVLVVAGKEKGRQGRVERVLVDKKRVVVEGVNMVVRHVRPTPGVRQAGRVQQESPLHVSNVMLICSGCNRATRVRHGVLENGRKVRVCQRCGETIT
jgi:large subunit ribosomal protein L24